MLKSLRLTLQWPNLITILCGLPMVRTPLFGRTLGPLTLVSVTTAGSKLTRSIGALIRCCLFRGEWTTSGTWATLLHTVVFPSTSPRVFTTLLRLEAQTIYAPLCRLGAKVPTICLTRLLIKLP